MNNQFKTASFRNKDSFQQDNMVPVMCPFRETCPRYGVERRKRSKGRCSGRLFDVSLTNGVARMRYYCKSQRRVMNFCQNGDVIAFMGIPQNDVYVPCQPLENQPMAEISCPTCGDRILDVYSFAGNFHLEIKCTIEGDFVTIDGQRDYPHRPPLIKILH